MKTTFLIVTVLCVIVLNVVATRTITSSSLVTKQQKAAYLLLIWLIPLLGFFSAIWLFSSQMKKAKKSRDNELVSALNEFTKKVNTINEDIKQQHKDKQVH